MKVKQQNKADQPDKSRRQVLEQLIAQTRLMRKSNDLTQVEEATTWEKLLRERLDEVNQVAAAA